jgi:very-short-patch-repair endonuclease
MASDDDAPSWSQHDGRRAQREHRRANARAQRLRHELTPTERRLWKALRELNKSERFHFRRQPAIGPWVYDFGDLARRLLIEADGGVHEHFADVADRDAAIESWAAKNGFRIARFSNDQIWGDLDGVILAIRKLVSDPHPLPPPHKGEGESHNSSNPDVSP